MTNYDLEYRGVVCIAADWESTPYKFVFLYKGHTYIFEQKRDIRQNADTDHIRCVIEQFLEDVDCDTIICGVKQRKYELESEKKQMKKCEMKLGAWLKARKNGCEAIDKLRTELENTKKERDTYRERCDDIGEERDAVIRDYIEYRAKVDKSFETLAKQKRLFPVGIGDVVYDITLKDKEGKFTTEKPCLETSAVKPVKVTEGNFFDIIRRIEKKDVFFDEERAKKHVRKLCEGKK